MSDSSITATIEGVSSQGPQASWVCLAQWEARRGSFPPLASRSGSSGVVSGASMWWPDTTVGPPRSGTSFTVAAWTSRAKRCSATRRGASGEQNIAEDAEIDPIHDTVVVIVAASKVRTREQVRGDETEIESRHASDAVQIEGADALDAHRHPIHGHRCASGRGDGAPARHTCAHDLERGNAGCVGDLTDGVGRARGDRSGTLNRTDVHLA